MNLTIDEKLILQRAAKIVLARKSFWHYCKVLDPEFYRDHITHLKTLCFILQNFYNHLPLNASGIIYNNLMLVLPPRFGKTRTLVHFTDWILGENQEERIITGSYNDETASDFSKYARDGITKKKMDPKSIVFSDVFPGVRVKRGTSAHTKWALEGQHFNYMGVGIKGSVTSKGANIQIIDDLVKSAEDALNDNYLKTAWLWFSSTFLSRIEPTGKPPLRIVCMTRWSKQDPCGKLLEKQPEKWFVLEMEALDLNTNKLLCEDFLSMDTYLDIKSLMMEEIFMANYHGKPMDIKGRLYKGFKTYDKFPTDNEGKMVFDRIGAYVDTADTGSDYLACGTYLEYQGRAYLFDVYYTKEGMETTEPETAKRFVEFKVNRADIESNSGGMGFARNVRRHIWETHNSRSVKVRSFHQSKNKQSRILSESANVMENILMPSDWRYRWPKFYDHIMGYMKEGKNQVDDGPDMLTGIVEKMDHGKLRFA